MSSTSVTPVHPNARVGTPAPGPNPPANLSEKEKMMQGFAYHPGNPELREGRTRAKILCRKLIDAPADAKEERREILRDLLHPDSKDKDVYIRDPFTADYGYNIRVGNHFLANFDCVILDCATVDIGDDCLLAPGVHIYTVTHPVDPLPRRSGIGTYYELAYPVKIGHTCWIGGRAIICPGVTIGDNVVVAAGAVVTKDVPSNVVVAGNPAKIIRFLDGAELPEDLKKQNGLV